MNQANDQKNNVCRLMKEEHDAKLQSAIKSENVYKNKLLLLEEKFESTEVQLEQTENKLKEYMSKLSNMNQVNFLNVVVCDFNWGAKRILVY